MHFRMMKSPAPFLALLLPVLPAAAQVPQPEAPPPAPAAPVPQDPAPQDPPPAAPAPDPAAPAAQEESAGNVEVQLSPSAIGVGEQAMLSFRIADGAQLENYPQQIEVNGLNIQFAGTSSQSFSYGNRTIRSIELRYYVEGLETGTYTIPSQNFTVGGKQVGSRCIDITVNDGPPVDESLKPQAQLSISRTEMWEGEEVPVTVSVLMHRAVQLTNQPFPVIKSDGIAVSRFDRNASIDQAEINGQLWNAWQMPSSIVAIKSGDITLGPAEVKLEALMPAAGAQRDPFGGFSTVRRTLTVKSNTVPIKVKPLPDEGKPDDFTGAVGAFQVVARTDTTASGPIPVQLGEPIGFEVYVVGTGNFDAVNAPSLEKPDGLRAYKPKLSLENRGLGSEQGQKGFTQILFTQKPGPVSVVFTMPYFDPVAGKYAVAKSQPIEFMVTGSEAAAAAADSAAAAETRDFSTAAEIPPPGEDLRDILPHPVDAGTWYSLTGAAMPVHPLVLHGLPALVAAGLLGAGIARRVKAWRLANRPPPYAPRECAAIARDLHRSGLSRTQFYGFVSEYAAAWEYWKKQALPAGHESLARVLTARDHWLYASPAPAAAEPVPADEQRQAAAALTSALSA